MQAPRLFDLPDARGKYGLVHNIGLGGAVVISLLRRPDFYHADGPDGRDRQVLTFFSVYLLSSGPFSDWDIITLMSYGGSLVWMWTRSGRSHIQKSYCNVPSCKCG